MKRHAFPLAITAVVTSLVLSGCGDDEPTDNAEDPASTPASETSEASPTEPSEPTTSATAEPTDSENTSGTAETVSVPVYFVADTPHGPRLFAEQREVEADNPSAESLALLMAGDVADPDYRTLVPADSLDTNASFDGVGDGGFYSLELTDRQWTERPDGMSASEAELAVQQIVYTLLSQAGDGDLVGATGGVSFHIGSEDTSFLGVETVAEPGQELEIRGLVNIGSPTEGEAVSDTFTASGEASSFEATVPWEVRDEAGEAVLTGFATAEGWLEGLYPWQSEVDVSELAPGTYTFVAMTDDPSGGAEGPGATEDTRTIVVE